MFRRINSTDKLNFIEYYSKKNNCSLKDSSYKFNKILKSGLPAIILNDKECKGICWIESIIINEKKVKLLSFLVDNWRVAESLIQILKWNFHGTVVVELEKHHFLNRTLNKNRFQFTHIKDNKNCYIFNFEKREFYVKPDYEDED